MKISGKKAQNTAKVPGDWLYMTPQEIGVRQIYEAFDEQYGYELEIWEDAGVLEVGMADGASVDIETAQIHPKDEITASFATEHQVKSVFLVTFKPETYEEAKNVMRKIIGKTGGFFCGDTEDFTPVFEA